MTGYYKRLHSEFPFIHFYFSSWPNHPSSETSKLPWSHLSLNLPNGSSSVSFIAVNEDQTGSLCCPNYLWTLYMFFWALFSSSSLKMISEDLSEKRTWFLVILSHPYFDMPFFFRICVYSARGSHWRETEKHKLFAFVETILSTFLQS